MEKEQNENLRYCSRCGAQIDEDDDFEVVNGEIVCTDCFEHHAYICDRCGSVVWSEDSYGDEDITLCRHCYENFYTRCSCCDALVHIDDVYHLDGNDYCESCYREEYNRSSGIHDYGYKPEPRFFGDSKRYFGVELEIDGAGKDSDNADEILSIANKDEEHVYVKGDGSLDDGLEIVSHPMSLEYHKQFQWEDVMKKALSLGYRSHQTSTCGLHVHVNRNSHGAGREEQELVISHILFFVEKNWNELLKFSRRSEYSMNRWAARYGYEKTGKEILDKAKKGNLGRYAAVNLMNYSTIEFRLFRGTLKYSTFIAALELVEEICNLAMTHTEEEIEKLSWSDFVSRLKAHTLISYLKERKLFINEDIEQQEEL